MYQEQTVKLSRGVNKASYDLLVEIFRFTKDFIKEYKYTFGESLKKETIGLIFLVYRAKLSGDGSGINAFAYFWAATSGSGYANYYCIKHSAGNILGGGKAKAFGYTIRLVRAGDWPIYNI